MANRLYIVSAPSGAGKTSLIASLIQRIPHLALSISHTTRPGRPQEQDGIDYHFVTKAMFEQMIAQGDFLEYANVFNGAYYYGTSKQWVESALLHTNVILEIDWQGAAQIRQYYPQAVSIFIFPPSLDALAKRLCQRSQDSSEVIKGRLALASSEMSHYQEFDYLVINDDFERAVADLMAIIQANTPANATSVSAFPIAATERAKTLMLSNQVTAHRQLIRLLLD